VSIMVFVVMRILPGDPLVAIFGPEGFTKLTDAERANYMAALGLSDPLWVQYLAWVKDILRGDFGRSFFRSESVADMILRRGPLTAEIALISVVLSWLVGIPVAIALLDASKNFVLARNLIPALVPLLAAVGIAVASPATRRLGTAIGALLFAYSLGFCVLASTDEQFQRPNWSAVAEQIGDPHGPRATVTWTLGEAPLRFYLSTGAIQVRAKERYDWLVKEVDFVSDGSVPAPPRRLLGPGFHQVADESTGRLKIRRYRFQQPGLAPLRLRRLRDARLDFRSNGVLLDGVGPD